MLLRRLSRHIGEQDWLAVVLDFFIVVLGVFIGVQLGNWNSARADRAAYEDALERYRAELAVNLETLETENANVMTGLGVVGDGIDALQSCDDSEEATAAVNRAINLAMGTFGISVRDSALRELTTSPRLLSLKADDERRRFSDTAHIVDVYAREANFIEVIPLEKRLQDNPLIGVGQPDTVQTTYFGQDFSRQNRRLELAVPVSVACADNTLIKDLFTWERWQAAQPAVGRILAERFQEDLDWLDARS
ncbi:hypothetical protein [Henriciella algicola]|uniref:hypothetical protein n=1 Tax=Henriciella algicola TaxID=1608422 RepID=UPI0011C3DB63|nr:hypothetical protein [Henriciella algicola]